jgi:dienelactone hydrolase
VQIESGATILHYRLVELLGAGAMGVVWKAIDTTLDREVAIKFLPEEFARDPERLARFEREAKLLASLNHPNIAVVYGLHHHEGLHFLAMELVRGSSLSSVIAGRLEPLRLIDLAIGITDGLAAAHRQHVIHRDHKPDNIMIDVDGRPRILDFGLAKLSAIDSNVDEATALRDATTTRKGTVLGTVSYMSPEQAQGETLTPRSDVFSFGIVLYEMITGTRPFAGSNPVSVLTSILRDTPPPPSRIAPAAPPPLDALTARCLEKEPEARPDASAARDQLMSLRTALTSGVGLAPHVPRRKAPIFIAALIALVALAGAGSWMVRRHAQSEWLRKEALPQLASTAERIQALEEGREAWDAFILARSIDAVSPDEALVASLRKKFTRELTVTSNPPGATVSVRYYDEPDKPALILGKTPLKTLFPRGFTRMRLELPGKEPVDDIVWNHPIVEDTFAYELKNPGEVPPDMSWVPAGSFELFLPGLDHLKKEPIQPFLIDRHEVTNRDYKRFVDAGGYNDARYWREPFVDGGATLTFEQAKQRLVDTTGRPGPSTWELGSYRAGEENDPVAGVSWYEAAAYAAWAGKRLPTLFHWNRVAFTMGSSRIIPMANLGGGKGVKPVGATRSMNRFGAMDLAGNVREWTSNESDGHERFILGGGWSDPDWAFSDAYAQPPFDRSPTNGFRCIRIIGNEPNLPALERVIERPHRDFLAEKPVSDATFAQFLNLFQYDKTPLDAKIEEEKPTPDGVRQKITFKSAYGDRMMAYLFLPKNSKPPYPLVVVFPGSGSISTRSSATLELGRFDFLQRSGRAVLWPIYKGTYERGGELLSDYPTPTTFYRDYVIMWGKDLARSIDYAETRTDLDAGRLAYYGLSWGGAQGAIMPAIEPRIDVNVLYVAGLNFQKALPEADQINYVTRVKQPTLILNGELDFFFPTETSQKPMFQLLGTPAADKKRLVFPGGHSVPRTELIRESLLWLDHYLGEVNR